jgi:predicted RNA methylase
MQRRDPDGVETSAIAALVGLEGMRVGDVGCGTGRLTAWAAAHAAAVYAFDPDGDSVAKAEASLSREARKRVRFASGGLVSLGVRKGLFGFLGESFGVAAHE